MSSVSKPDLTSGRTIEEYRSSFEAANPLTREEMINILRNVEDDLRYRHEWMHENTEGPTGSCSGCATCLEDLPALRRLLDQLMYEEWEEKWEELDERMRWQQARAAELAEKHGDLDYIDQGSDYDDIPW